MTDFPKTQLLTLNQVADFLNVSQASVRRWTNKGKLTCYRLGGKNGSRRFAREDVLSFLSKEEAKFKS